MMTNVLPPLYNAVIFLLFFNEPNYLKIYWTDLHQIFTIVRHRWTGSISLKDVVCYDDPVFGQISKTGIAHLHLAHLVF